MQSLPGGILRTKLVFVFFHDLIKNLLLSHPLLSKVFLSSAFMLIYTIVIGQVLLFPVIFILMAHKVLKIEHLNFVILAWFLVCLVHTPRGYLVI